MLNILMYYTPLQTFSIQDVISMHLQAVKNTVDSDQVASSENCHTFLRATGLNFKIIHVLLFRPGD